MVRAEILVAGVLACALSGCSPVIVDTGAGGGGGTTTGMGGTSTSSSSSSASTSSSSSSTSTSSSSSSSSSSTSTSSSSSSTSTSSSSSSSGTGGGCMTAADCLDYGTPCVTTTCTTGVCGWIFAPFGQPLPAQTPGDCQLVACDGDVGSVSLPDDTDLPDDGNPCTQDLCANGIPSHVPVAVGASCPGGICDGAGACVGCISDADCPPSTACATNACVTGACVATHAPAGQDAGGQTAGDCSKRTCDGAGNVAVVADDTDVPVDGNPCTLDACSNGVPSHPPAPPGAVCGAGLECDGAGHCVACIADAECGPASACAKCVGGTCQSGCVCPTAPTGPAGSLPDCDSGLDPTKGGGELLWAKGVFLGSSNCIASSQTVFGAAFGLTGDIAVGGTCYQLALIHGFAGRLNAVGVFAGQVDGQSGGTGSFQVQAAFDPSNRMYFYAHRMYTYNQDTFAISPGPTYGALLDPNAPQLFQAWGGDGLGNYFFVTQTDQALTMGNLAFPGAGRYLVRGGMQGDSIEANFNDSFLPDGTGGILRYSSTFFSRVDAAQATVYTRSVSVKPAVLAPGDGSAVLSASAATVDLGCGPQAGAPGGSTMVARLDLLGTCTLATSVAAPNLHVALAPGGGLVLSGTVGTAAVDLGGGPLSPLGTADFVIVELDAAGNHVWSRRFGGPGITFDHPWVVVSTAGNVYLKTGFTGTLALGGAPITAAYGDTVVASFTPAGAHRWSRRLPLSNWTSGGPGGPPGGYTADVDPCGATVVVSPAPAFDVGCGPVLNGGVFGPNTVVARFAP